jgi:hypothetical protein
LRERPISDSRKFYKYCIICTLYELLFIVPNVPRVPFSACSALCRLLIKPRTGRGGTITFNSGPFGSRIEGIPPAGATISAEACPERRRRDGDNVVEELDGAGPSLARHTQRQPPGFEVRGSSLEQRCPHRRAVIVAPASAPHSSGCGVRAVVFWPRVSGPAPFVTVESYRLPDKHKTRRPQGRRSSLRGPRHLLPRPRTSQTPPPS